MSVPPPMKLPSRKTLGTLVAPVMSPRTAWMSWQSGRSSNSITRKSKFSFLNCLKRKKNHESLQFHNFTVLTSFAIVQYGQNDLEKITTRCFAIEFFTNCCAIGLSTFGAEFDKIEPITKLKISPSKGFRSGEKNRLNKKENVTIVELQAMF